MDILAFLKQGTLPGIYTGMTLKEFRQTVGDMNAGNVQYYDEDNPSFGFFYLQEGVKFTFIENKLNAIKIDPTCGHFTLLENFVLNQSISIDEFIKLFTKLNIEWKLLRKYTFEKDLIMTLDSGVQLFFRHQNKSGLVFSKLQKHASKSCLQVT